MLQYGQAHLLLESPGAPLWRRFSPDCQVRVLLGAARPLAAPSCLENVLHLLPLLTLHSLEEAVRALQPSALAPSASGVGEGAKQPGGCGSSAEVYLTAMVVLSARLPVESAPSAHCTTVRSISVWQSLAGQYRPPLMLRRCLLWRQLGAAAALCAADGDWDAATRFYFDAIAPTADRARPGVRVDAAPSALAGVLQDQRDAEMYGVVEQLLPFIPTVEQKSDALGCILQHWAERAQSVDALESRLLADLDKYAPVLARMLHARHPSCGLLSSRVKLHACRHYLGQCRRQRSDVGVVRGGAPENGRMVDEIARSLHSRVERNHHIAFTPSPAGEERASESPLAQAGSCTEQAECCFAAVLLPHSGSWSPAARACSVRTPSPACWARPSVCVFDCAAWLEGSFVCPLLLARRDSVLFTCSHHFAACTFYTVVLVEFARRMQQLPKRIDLSCKLLVQIYRGAPQSCSSPGRKIRAACPVCVFNSIRQDLITAGTAMPLDSWDCVDVLGWRP